MPFYNAAVDKIVILKNFYFGGKIFLIILNYNIKL